MPNKTIYVAEGQLPLFDRAQELAGGNLSAAIARALARWVQAQEGIAKGHQEITLTVGEPNRQRVKRFVGTKLLDSKPSVGGELGQGPREFFTVYLTARDRLAVHERRFVGSERPLPRDWVVVDDPRNWPDPDGRLSESTKAALHVLGDADELDALIGLKLKDRVRHILSDPGVEDLDI